MNNESLKIGITERGDAGINLSWVNKMHTVDGVVLITKNITEQFKQVVLEQYEQKKPVIVHCTCTGYGGTALEPCVPNYKAQLDSLADLIDRGFPACDCVLRIDPIFPSEKGLKKVREVMDYFISLQLDIRRIRVSIVDEYRHVKERYRQCGWNPLYGDNFGPSFEQVKAVADVLNSYQGYAHYNIYNDQGNHYRFDFEMCAEDLLAEMVHGGQKLGCISLKDFDYLGFDEDYIDKKYLTENPQGRKGCHCLSCKTELLTERKPCPNGCVYCFWK